MALQRRRRGALLTAGAAVAVLATGGCGDEPPENRGSESPETPLVTALSQVRFANQGYVEFGDLAAQRAAGMAPDDPTSPLYGYGWSSTAVRQGVVRRTLGLDGGKADRALQIGRGRSAGRFDGADTAAVEAGARKLDGRKDGTIGPLDRWRLAPDDRIQPTGPLAALSPAGEFNVLGVGGGTVVRAPNGALADELTADGKGDTLATDKRYRASAECLGTPLAALLDSDLTASGEVGTYVLAAGVTGTDDARLGQTACRTALSKQAAEIVAEAVRERLRTGRTANAVPWSDLLTKTEVDVVTGSGPTYTVRLTATSRKSPRLILDLTRDGDLSTLFAGPPSLDHEGYPDSEARSSLRILPLGLPE
ncbi:hypothetical protein AB0K02_03945 [Streptomyces sp. NPDC049597]|uniref:hypothetical protein n=1 Tax=Streptomyces sp. NPDC049597 TaxID=3155276 RepID=UPI00342CB9EC